MKPADSTARRTTMRLYDQYNNRLYVNASERLRFLVAAKRFPPLKRTLCLTLLYTGCRISEALALTAADVQVAARLVTFRTLKRRQTHSVREVPVPKTLIRNLDHWHQVSKNPGSRTPLWQRDGKPLGRVAAYRIIKAVMAEAEIDGAQACPKGLRHGYGIHATLSGVQLHMLSKWMGHASITTTQIYADACGPEEREIAQRMWETPPRGKIGPTKASPGISDRDLHILARAYDHSVNNPNSEPEDADDLRWRLGLADRAAPVFSNERYFTVELQRDGSSFLLTIDRTTEAVVGSVDVSIEKPEQ